MVEVLTADNHYIEITNTKKVLFPEDGFTKRDLIQYYQDIAPFMLPHLEGRPLTMHRFPSGIGEEGFYHKEVPEYFPSWIKRVELGKKDGRTRYLICNNTATLIYIANLACITPHVWLSRNDRIAYPDMIIFDLDPSDDDFEKVRQATFYLRDLLNELNLSSVIKTTGSRGVHIIIPLDRRIIFDKVRVIARKIAGIMAVRYPEIVTVEQRKNKRGNRVYIDTQRNSYGQTAVAPYAIRAKHGAPVATPISWEELKNPELNPQSYNIENIFKRLSEKKNVWADWLDHPNSLTKTLKKLEELK